MIVDGLFLFLINIQLADWDFIHAHSAQGTPLSSAVSQLSTGVISESAPAASATETLGDNGASNHAAPAAGLLAVLYAALMAL